LSIISSTGSGCTGVGASVTGRVPACDDALREKGENVTDHRHEIERLETEIHRIVFQETADNGSQQIHRHDARNVTARRE
jgi:hypothetical protein